MVCGCSGVSSVIGSAEVESLVRRSCATRSVTDPLRATIARARDAVRAHIARHTRRLREADMAVRRDLIPMWVGPFTPYLLWLLIPLAASWLAVEAQFLQSFLDTTSLTGPQWAVVLSLSVVPAIVIESDKARRRRA